MPRHPGALSGALAPVLLCIFGVERCRVTPASLGPSGFARGCGVEPWGSGSFNPTRRQPATPPFETDVVPEVACGGDGSRGRGCYYAFAMKSCSTSCAGQGMRDASFRSSAATERESGSCRCRSGSEYVTSDNIDQLQLLLRLRGGEGPCPDRPPRQGILDICIPRMCVVYLFFFLITLEPGNACFIFPQHATWQVWPSDESHRQIWRS